MDVRPGDQEHVPLARDPDWRRLRDAVLHLVVRRAGEAEAPGFGDEADERFVRALASLRTGTGHDAALRSAVFDLGCDLGRHVYSKRILEDALHEGLAILATDLEQSGLGRLSVDHVFHRRASVTFAPSAGAEGADPAVLGAYLAGLFLGALGEAFNCDVTVAAAEPGQYALALGAGHNVNEEVRGHA